MNKKMWMGLFIAFIMIFSIFGFVADFIFQPSGTTTLEYGDFIFRTKENQYFTNIDGFDHGFIFFPGDLETIQIDDAVKSLLDSPVITVSYDPSSNISKALAEAQYYFEAQLQNTKTIERALTDNEGTTLVQKSCDDATEAQPVIFLQQGDESSLKVEKTCITLTAVDAYDLIQQTERIIYSSLGVMS